MDEKKFQGFVGFTQVVVKHVTNIRKLVLKASMEIQSIMRMRKGKVISGFGIWEKLFRRSNI